MVSRFVPTLKKACSLIFVATTIQLLSREWNLHDVGNSKVSARRPSLFASAEEEVCRSCLSVEPSIPGRRRITSRHRGTARTKSSKSSELPAARKRSKSPKDGFDFDFLEGPGHHMFKDPLKHLNPFRDAFKDPFGKDPLKHVLKDPMKHPRECLDGICCCGMLHGDPCHPHHVCHHMCKMCTIQ